MNLFAQSSWIKILLVLFLVLLGAGTLIYNNYLVDKILEQERRSVELWAKAIEFNADPSHQQATSQLLEVQDILRMNKAVGDSVITMLRNIEAMRNSRDFVTDELILDEDQNFRSPAVLVDSEGNPIATPHQRFTSDSTAPEITIEYSFINVDPEDINTEAKRTRLVHELKSVNPPIQIVIEFETTRIVQFVYYGESPTVVLLRYVPYIQIAILTLLLGIGYTTYKSITRFEQSNLWVGMAKEAAHQLGTPISSLFGWIHLFRDEYKDDESGNKIIDEIENDVQRLSGVAERFGKIGSEPELNEMNIKPVLEEVVGYMEKRLPRLGKGVEVRKSLKAEGSVKLNPELFQWAVENLVKNAMDALKDETGETFISISSRLEDGHIVIDIQDSGSGIEARNAKNVFKPGFSTKKRGWGLGLSLTKRIIEDYHKGKVFVLRSELGEGTTMRIMLEQVG